MNSKHDPVNGQLFYDPRAEAEDEGTGTTTSTDERTESSHSAPRSSEAIHRALFSAR